jgi:hypothetical protein
MDDADEAAATDNNSDDLLVVRETKIDDRTFRLRAHRVTGGRLMISFESHDAGGRDVGSLAGEIPMYDLLPAAEALASLARGTAVILGQNRAGATTRYDEVRREYPNAWRSWTPQDDDRLRRLHGEGLSVSALSQEFGRRPGGIRARLEKLGLVITEASDGDEGEDPDEF